MNNPPKGRIPKAGWIKYCLRIPLYGGYLRDYRQNPPTAGDIYTHLLFTVHPSGMLTACVLHLFTSPIVHFDLLNQFHVHTYISHWGPEEQSPSLEINFNSYKSHTPTSCPSGWSRCPLDEGGGNW